VIEQQPILLFAFAQLHGLRGELPRERRATLNVPVDDCADKSENDDEDGAYDHGASKLAAGENVIRRMREGMTRSKSGCCHGGVMHPRNGDTHYNGAEAFQEQTTNRSLRAECEREPERDQ